MRFVNSNIRNYLAAKIVARYWIFFFFSVLFLKGGAQEEKNVIDVLIKMGFENVGCSEACNERVYILQNSAYRLNGVGIGKAVDIIQKMGLPVNKSCRIIVLDNNVPQVSLYYHP
ncbi:MAG: hypothetical protein LKI29_05355, partial [Bacteroides sp.]|nr:hypothetical protein [Bacteroides sp.]